MYLSKCLITSRRPINPYEIHKKIWLLFPDQATRARDFLFRIEHNSPVGQTILLQSTLQPISAEAGPIILDQKEIHYSFQNEITLQFFLTANPTKRIRAKGKKKGNQGRCRVPIIDEDEIHNWLKRKFITVGQLRNVIIAGKDTLYFRKNGRSGKIVTINYTGSLFVEDSKSLLTCVETGIGPAKAFGCGLLSLALV